VSIVNEDVDVFSERLRSEKGKDIWLVGGAELVATFLDSGQVDEFIIHVIPKMIGEGIPLVAARHRDLGLKLLATKSFPDGWSDCTIPSEVNDPTAVAPIKSCRDGAVFFSWHLSTDAVNCLCPAGYIVTGGNKRSILLSFSTWMETLAHRTARCSECDNLEREYQHSIDEIYSVVRMRFPSLGEKIQDLHKWQDSRDRALHMFYEHKASHSRRVA